MNTSRFVRHSCQLPVNNYSKPAEAKIKDMKTLFYLSALLLTSLFLGLTIPVNTCLAQTGTWTTLAPMDHARAYFAATEWNGKIFVFGGAITDVLSSDDVEVYDINTGTWTPRESLPEKMCGMSAVTLGDKIYLIGGATSLASPAFNKVYEYDPILDVYTTKQAMPSGRAYHSSCVVNGEIYTIGGSTVALGQIYGTVIKYNPSNGAGWVTVASLNTPRVLLASEEVNGKIYAIGGAFDNSLLGLATIEVFDPASPGAWVVLDGSNMQVGRARHGSAVINGVLYALGGASGSTELMSVEKINIAQGEDAWAFDSPMTTARRSFVTVEANGKIYVAGGLTGSALLSRFDRFNPVVTAVREPKKDISELLVQNFPNPFSGQTTIQYEVSAPVFIEITVQDAAGQILKTVVSGYHAPGTFTFNLDANDFENGVYFYTMKLGNSASCTRKMVVLK